MNFPHPNLLVVRREERRRDLLMDHRNLNKCKTLRKSDKTNLLWQTDYLWTENTQCSAVHNPTITTTTTTIITSLSTLFTVNIQSLMRKFYFWNFFHFSNSSELKIILLYNYHWGNPKPGSYCAFIFQYLHKSEERSRLTLGIHLQGNI